MKIRFGLGVLVERVIWLFCNVVDVLAVAVAANPFLSADAEEEEDWGGFRELLDEWHDHGIS